MGVGLMPDDAVAPNETVDAQTLAQGQSAAKGLESLLEQIDKLTAPPE